MNPIRDAMTQLAVILADNGMKRLSRVVWKVVGNLLEMQDWDLELQVKHAS